MAGIRWASFDCYGTLIDWQHGIATCAELVAPGHGRALLEAYHRHEHAIQQRSPRMRYRDVLAATLRQACAQQGVRLHDDDAGVLAAGLPYWPVFGEARAVLTALREAGWNLAILTNCDRDLVAHSLRRLQVTIDVVVTAEDAGSYKPALNHFRRFQAATGVTTGNWVHVAQSYLHDIRPAHELGVPRVWVDRLGERDDDALADVALADAVLPDLGDLVATVQAVHLAGRTPG
jgi:2-haloacid dehalogenase